MQQKIHARTHVAAHLRPNISEELVTMPGTCHVLHTRSGQPREDISLVPLEQIRMQRARLATRLRPYLQWAELNLNPGLAGRDYLHYPDFSEGAGLKSRSSHPRACIRIPSEPSEIQMLKPHPRPVCVREMSGHVYCFDNSTGSWQRTTGHVPRSGSL